MILKAKKAVLWFTKDDHAAKTIWLEMPTYNNDDEDWEGNVEFLNIGTEKSEKLFDKFAPNLEAGEEGIKKVTLVSQEDL